VTFNTSKAPLNDVRVRQALAYCTDRDQVLTIGEVPASRAADSQFQPDSPYYVKTDFPNNDVAKGTELINAYKAENPGPVSFSLGTTPVPGNTATTALLAQQWARPESMSSRRPPSRSKFACSMPPPASTTPTSGVSSPPRIPTAITSGGSVPTLSARSR